MKAFIVAAAVGLCLALVSLGGHAQEMSFRSGVVTGISPIQVQGQQASSNSGGSATGGALGRMFGRALGRAVGKAVGDSQMAYDASSVAQGMAQDATTTRQQGGGPTSTAYMVMIRFDDGNQSAIQSPHANNLKVGGRVKVFGSGSSAQIVAD